MSLPAADSFTNSDGTQLITHSSNWTLNNGDFDIQSNALAPDSSGNELGAYWNADSFNGNHYAEATLVATSQFEAIGVAVRCQSGDDLYGYYCDQAFCFLWRMDNGVFNQLDTASTPETSSVIRLEVDGTSLSGKDDGVEILSAIDSNHSGGAAGVSGYGDSTGARIDDWEGGNLGVTDLSVSNIKIKEPAGLPTPLGIYDI